MSHVFSQQNTYYANKHILFSLRFSRHIFIHNAYILCKFSIYRFTWFFMWTQYLLWSQFLVKSTRWFNFKTIVYHSMYTLFIKTICVNICSSILSLCIRDLRPLFQTNTPFLTPSRNKTPIIIAHANKHFSQAPLCIDSTLGLHIFPRHSINHVCKF